MTNNLIYLDNNATTQVDKRVLDAMLPFFTNNYANPSSTHQFGLNAREAVKTAREQVASLISCKPDEIVFTSGATEAINLAVKGIVGATSFQRKHIISVCTEHKAMLDTFDFIKRSGIEVTYLPVQSDGLLDVDILRQNIRKDTFLVSVMIANNEIGVLQPIKEIASITHEAGAIFMTDGTQAVGKIPVNVDELGIDMMCLSGHKIYAPKGTGALFIRSVGTRKIKLEPQIHGGGHEHGLRSGTLNVPGIVALGKACEICEKEMMLDSNRIQELRDTLEHGLLQIKKTKLNGNRIQRMYNVTNICFSNVDSEALIISLKGISVSNGSACTSISMYPSHVLKGIGLTDQDAYSSIRLSLGRFNTNDEIAVTITEIRNVVMGLRSMAGDCI